MVIQNIVFETDIVRYRMERFYSESEGEFYEASFYHHIDDTGAWVDGVNHYFSTLCNPYYSSFFTHRRKNHDTVVGLLAFLEESLESQAFATLHIS